MGRAASVASPEHRRVRAHGHRMQGSLLPVHACNARTNASRGGSKASWMDSSTWTCIVDYTTSLLITVPTKATLS